MTVTKETVVQDGSTQGALYQALLDSDSRPVPATYRLQAPYRDAQMTVPAERYTSRAFHDLEVEKIWKRVWQVACREEDIPEVGDYLPYDIAGIKVLVVRSAPGTISAYHNVCLHRGRVLKEYPGRDTKLTCAFHGITWNIDGSLAHVPCRWDFPQVGAEWPLPPVKVDTWGGFVFINLDDGCEPLADFLGTLPEHFADWPLEDRYKQVHVGKILRCNWKLAQEAFMESFHVVATHPQLLAGLSDTITQYDAFETFTRAITPNGVPSRHLKWDPTDQEMIDALTDRTLDSPILLEVPEGVEARKALADVRRGHLVPLLGEDAANGLSDAEMCDSLTYTVFPNFHPWGSYNRTLYRFRPFGNDPGMCIMECMILSPFTGARPPASPLRMLGVDDDWTEAWELGLLTRVFNQDVYNLPRVQEGLESGSLTEVVFARYQETKIRFIEQMIEDWVTRP
jgi:phenylpropionate dioxygenase-like ring-hydroxylating dioxygenase large terminal subunit